MGRECRNGDSVCATSVDDVEPRQSICRRMRKKADDTALEKAGQLMIDIDQNRSG